MPAPLRILLLAENPDLRAAGAQALQRLPAAVSAAASLAEAPAQGPAFDAAVIDAALPDGAGFQAAKRLLSRAQPPLILFLTAKDAFTDRIAAFSAGAVDYIAEPFSSDEISARVGIHLCRDSAPRCSASSAWAAEVKERAHQDLSDFIIHDVKAPLSAVKATLDLLRWSGALPPDALERLAEVYDHAAVVTLLLINDRLDLDRSRSGRLPTNQGVVDLESLLSRIKGLVLASLKQDGAALSTQLHPPLAFVRSDYKLLFRCLLNLADNAFRRGAPGQGVSVQIALGNGRLRVAVADRGPRIADAEKPLVFGLPGGAGLSFCRAAAATLGGRIWVEDRPGGGSVFVMDIPAERIEPA